MILEAQFGPNIAPIERPRINRPSPTTNSITTNGATTTIKPDPDNKDTIKQEPTYDQEHDDEFDEQELEDLEEAEIMRLAALGIPCPGIEIKVDKHVARVWLETLEVECAYPVLRDRVRVVVERAVETVADMWSSKAALSTSQKA